MLLVCNWPVGEGAPQFGNKKGGTTTSIGFSPASHSSGKYFTPKKKNKMKQKGKKKHLAAKQIVITLTEILDVDWEMRT